ncbi:MAG: hypothetical protein ACP5Q0_07945, partial [Halothiobacillus sp.]
MKLSRFFVTGVFLLNFAALNPALAATAPVNISGSLFNKQLGAAQTGVVNVVFTVYSTAQPGASVLWSQTLPVTFADGRFNVTLGNNPANPLPDNLDIRTAVVGVQIGADAELSPRLSLIPPYANSANTVTGDITPTS